MRLLKRDKNTTHYLPKEVSIVFEEYFGFPKQPLFGVVATICMDNGMTVPQVRTMRIYDFDQDGCPILLTHVLSHKWQELINHPYLSINMVSDNKLTQVIVCGKVQLDTPQTAPERAKRYWSLIRPDVKKIYCQDYAIGQAYRETQNLTIPLDAPNSLGIARLSPNFWEILKLNPEYVESNRNQFHLNNGEWQGRRIHVG